MRACGVHTYADYHALLDRTPAEFERLRDALTINVTRFYRNAETWNLLRRGSDSPSCALRTTRPDPGLERGLLLGRGGLHPGDPGRRAPRAHRTLGRARAAHRRRDRRRPGQPRAGPGRALSARESRPRCRPIWRPLLRARRSRASGRGAGPRPGLGAPARSQCHAAAARRLPPHPLPQRGDLLRPPDAGAALRRLRRRAGAGRLSGAGQGGDAARTRPGAARARGPAGAGLSGGPHEPTARSSSGSPTCRSGPPATSSSRSAWAAASRSCSTMPRPRWAGWRTCCCPRPALSPPGRQSRPSRPRPRCRGCSS